MDLSLSLNRALTYHCYRLNTGFLDCPFVLAVGVRRRHTLRKAGALMLIFRRKALPTCAVALPVALAGWLLLPGAEVGEAGESLLLAAGQPRQLFPQPLRGSEGASAASLFREAQQETTPVRPPPPAASPPPASVPAAAREETQPLPPLPPRKPLDSPRLAAGAVEAKSEGRRVADAPIAVPPSTVKPEKAGSRLSWSGEVALDAEAVSLSPPPAVIITEVGEAAVGEAASPESDAAGDSDLSEIRHLVQQALEEPEVAAEEGKVIQAAAEGHLPAAVIARQGAEAPPLASPIRLPSSLDLRAWERRDFIAERQRLRESIDQREREGRPVGPQILDLVRLYAARAMAHEALSLLDGLDERELLPRQRAAARALGDVLRVWRAPEAEQKLAMLGDPAFADWADWAAWTAYGRAARHQWQGAADLAGEGLQRLAAYPRVLRVPLLIALTEALMMTGSDLTMVGEALGLLEGERLEPADRAALGYLTALAQEARGEARQAFESYLAAARGDGPYAQKARIAVVDVGVSSGQMDLKEGEALLSSAHQLWRGDRLEVEVLKRLAALRLELEDDVGVLEALARLALNFSGQPIAEQALYNAGPLLDELYRVPAQRERSLGQRIAEHERLRRAFGAHPFFMSYREAFAGDLADAGLKAAAAQEYALLAEDTSGRQRQAYSLKRAATLLEAGAQSSAREVLRAMTLPGDPELARQWRPLGGSLGASGEG